METTILTKGITKQSVYFAVPFFLANLIQNLFQTADSIMIGTVSAKAALGVRISGQLILLVTNLAIGLSMGATILVGRFNKSKDDLRLRSIASMILSIATLLAGATAVISIFFGYQLLYWIGTPDPEVFAYSRQYLLVCEIGMIFCYRYHAASSVLRGMGDSNRPLLYMVVSYFTNILLDMLFIRVFDFAVYGAALATVLSQCVGVLLGTFRLKKMLGQTIRCGRFRFTQGGSLLLQAGLVCYHTRPG